MERIYSDIKAEVITDELAEGFVQIYDNNGNRYRPNLILPNMLAVKNLHEYLTNVLKENEDYFKDEPDN